MVPTSSVNASTCAADRLPRQQRRARGARRSGEHGVRCCARGVGWRELSHALCAARGARRFTEAGEEDVAHVADAGADDGQVLSPHAAQGGAV